MAGPCFVCRLNTGICILATLLCCVLAASTGCSDNEADDTTEIVAEDEPNDTSLQATSILVGVTVLGAVDQSDDPRDFYLLSVLVDGSYTITLSGFGPSDLDMFLYDRNGFLLASAAPDGATREIDRFLDADAQYVIEVRAVDAPSTTAYTLRVDG